MENRPADEKPLDVEVFFPESVELIDPARVSSESHPRPPQRKIRSRKRLALFLFLATCGTTFLAGMTLSQDDRVLAGLTYSGAVMLILLAHEMGHYLQARRYGVPASLPYFIPLPLPPIGTMGAVIFQGVEVVDETPTSDLTSEEESAPTPRHRRIRCLADRKEMFDIAISGPLAGLLIALPIAYFGVLAIQEKDIIQASDQSGGMRFGDPLLLKWMISYVHRPLAANEDVTLNPLLFAGWVGLFITALNLIPIGQLDGGHILYTLIGKRAHVIATLLLFGAVAYMVVMQYYAYILMVILLFLMGPRHPPTRDDTVPLGRFRTILGWLTLAFIIIGFTPTPIINM